MINFLTYKYTIMPLRGGKEYLKKMFPMDCQPFNPILLREKVYEVNIDFDEASRQWRKNKVQLGEGMFMYKRYSERIFKQ